MVIDIVTPILFNSTLKHIFSQTIALSETVLCRLVYRIRKKPQISQNSWKSADCILSHEDNQEKISHELHFININHLWFRLILL